MIELGDRDAVLSRLARVLDASRADETHVALWGGSVRHVAFSRDEVVTSWAEHSVGLRARSVLLRGGGARVGGAAVAALDDDAAAELLRRAEQAAEDGALWPGWYALVVPELYAASAQPGRGYHDTSTASAGVAALADRAADALLPARRRGLDARGYCRITLGEPDPLGVVAVANTQGLRRHHFGTRADAFVRITTPGGGAAEVASTSRQLGAIDLARDVERAASRAEASEHAVLSDELRGAPVLLEPPVVYEVVRALLPAFSTAAIAAGRSILHGNPGQLAGVPAVTLTADPTDPLLSARPFDDEGIPTRQLTLIREGRTVDMTAPRDPRAYSRDATGHGREPDVWGDAVARHVVLRAGSGAVDDVLARHPRCAVVGRLSDAIIANARDAVVTGIARDGVLLARDGEVVGSAGEAGLTARAWDILLNVIDASDPIPVGDMAVPALLVDPRALELVWS